VATNQPRSADDTSSTQLPLIDTSPPYQPQFIPLSPTVANPDPTAGYTVVAEGYDSQTTKTGGKFVAFENDSTNSVILAFGGTDGLNATNWKADLFYFGFNQWEAAKRCQKPFFVSS
jgi:hypothetical protein